MEQLMQQEWDVWNSKWEKGQYCKITLTNFLILGFLKHMVWLLDPWKLSHYRQKIRYPKLSINIVDHFQEVSKWHRCILITNFFLNFQRIANSQVYCKYFIPCCVLLISFWLVSLYLSCFKFFHENIPPKPVNILLLLITALLLIRTITK